MGKSLYWGPLFLSCFVVSFNVFAKDPEKFCQFSLKKYGFSKDVTEFLKSPDSYTGAASLGVLGIRSRSKAGTLSVRYLRGGKDWIDVVRADFDGRETESIRDLSNDNLTLLFDATEEELDLKKSTKMSAKYRGSNLSLTMDKRKKGSESVKGYVENINYQFDLEFEYDNNKYTRYPNRLGLMKGRLRGVLNARSRRNQSEVDLKFSKPIKYSGEGASTQVFRQNVSGSIGGETVLLDIATVERDHTSGFLLVKGIYRDMPMDYVFKFAWIDGTTKVSLYSIRGGEERPLFGVPLVFLSRSTIADIIMNYLAFEYLEVADRPLREGGNVP